MAMDEGGASFIPLADFEPGAACDDRDGDPEFAALLRLNAQVEARQRAQAQVQVQAQGGGSSGSGALH